MSYQSNRVYEDSYKELNRIMKANTSDKLSIDYKKLDDLTRSELRAAIKDVILRRKQAMYRTIQGVTPGNR